MVGSLAYQEVEYRIQSLNSSLQEYAIADTEAAFTDDLRFSYVTRAETD
jgi:hypothetical protein